MRTVGLKLAFDCRLTAYDAAYLELTLRTGAALATFDRPLAKAALTLSGELIFPEGAVKP